MVEQFAEGYAGFENSGVESFREQSAEGLLSRN
jgi:hypothetical protein